MVFLTGSAEAYGVNLWGVSSLVEDHVQRFRLLLYVRATY